MPRVVEVGVRPLFVAGVIWVGLLGGAPAASAQGFVPAPACAGATHTSAFCEVPGSPFTTGETPFWVGFSPADGLLATGSSAGINVFEVGRGGAMTPAPGAPAPFRIGSGQVPAFSPSGGYLAVPTGSGLVMLKVGDDGSLTEVSSEPSAAGASYVALSPSGGLVAASGGSTVQVFRVEDGGMLTHATENTIHTNSSFRQLAFVADGLLAVVNSSGVNVYTVTPNGSVEPPNGQGVTPDVGHAPGVSVNSMAFSPQRRLLAFQDYPDEATGPCCPDGGAPSVELFKVHPSGELTRVGPPTPLPAPLSQDYPYVPGMAFSPDGGLLATADYQTAAGNALTGVVSVFSVAPDPTLALVDGAPFAAPFVWRVAFSPRGGLLAFPHVDSHIFTVLRPTGGFEIDKTADHPQIDPGGVLRYTITLRPTSAAGGSGQVVDDLRGVLDKAAYRHDARASRGGVSVDAAAKQLVWRGTLGRGESATITYSVKVDDSAHGLLYNNVTGPAGSSCAAPAAPALPCVLETEVVTPPAPGPDLALSKTASSATVHPGGQVVFTLAVHNHGPGAASGVTVQDPTPAGLSLQTAHPSQGSCTITTEVVCRLGKVPDGGGALVVVSGTLALDASGSIVNEATVYGDQDDPHPDNNTARSTIHVTPLPPPPVPDPGPQPISDLVVTKHVSHTTARVGQTLTYTITVANKGSDPASDVRLIDTPRLPVRVLSIHPGQGSCQTGSPIRCRLGTLRAHARTSITIRASVTTAGAQVNAATSMSGSWDPAVQSSLALARTTIRPAVTPAPPPFTG